MSYYMFSRDIRIKELVKELSIGNPLKQIKQKSSREYSFIETLNRIIEYGDLFNDDIENGFSDFFYSILDNDKTENSIIKAFLEIYFKNGFDDLAYKLVSNIEKKINSDKAEVLIKTCIDEGDRKLYVDCNLEASNRWHKLAKKIYDNNEIDYDMQFTYIECFDRPLVYFLYSSHYNIKEFDSYRYLESYIFNESEVDKCVKCVDRILKEYFEDKKDVDRNKERTKYVYILGIVSKMLLPYLCSYVNNIKNKGISNKEQENIIKLFNYELNNEFKPYRDYIRGNNSNITFDLIIDLLVPYICSIKSIQNELLIKNESDLKLAYYCSLDSFKYLLPCCHKDDNMIGYMSLMNLSFMNDPNEGSAIKKIIGDDVEDIRGDAYTPYVFLKSYTSVIDYLPMWNMYAKDGTGLCVVLDLKEMFRNTNRKVELYRVCYINEDGSINEEHNRKINVNIIKDKLETIKYLFRYYRYNSIVNVMQYSLNAIMYLFKYDYYYSEEEIRQLETNDFYNDDIQYTEDIEDIETENIHLSNSPLIFKYADYPICIKEIYIGPKFEKANLNLPFIQTQIELMCKKLNIKVPKLIFSKIDYR